MRTCANRASSRRSWLSSADEADDLQAIAGRERDLIVGGARHDVLVPLDRHARPLHPERRQQRADRRSHRDLPVSAVEHDAYGGGFTHAIAPARTLSFASASNNHDIPAALSLPKCRNPNTPRERTYP